MTHPAWRGNPQSSTQINEPINIAPNQIDATKARKNTERVRALLWQHLPHGIKQEIAKQLGLRRESVTRQTDPQRTERLSEDVAIIGQLYLEQVGSPYAREVRELRYAGTDTIRLILPPGADTWTFTVNTKTGEVK